MYIAIRADEYYAAVDFQIIKHASLEWEYALYYSIVIYHYTINNLI
jgi:hypothetical protein